MKKLVIAAIIGGILFLVFFPEISRFGSSYALKPENQSKSWAPGLCFTVANINMRFFRFDSARTLYLECRKTWPKEDFQADIDYKVAMCLEKSGDTTGAISAYEAFMAAHPNHQWHAQAGKRIENIRANMD